MEFEALVEYNSDKRHGLETAIHDQMKGQQKHADGLKFDRDITYRVLNRFLSRR